MIQHPDFINDFARSRYEEMLQDAEESRRAQRFVSRQNPKRLGNLLSQWLTDLKIWTKPARRAENRA